LACLRERYQLEAVGIDPSSLLIDRARWRARRDRSDLQLAQALVQGRAEQLPFPDLCFSALFFECTLSLMENPLVCLAEAARVLAIGGHVIVTDIYQRSDVPCADASPRTCLAGAVTPAVMRDRLTRSGFVVRCWEDHTDCLKLLAARMVMAYGSLRDAWAQLYPGRSVGDGACDRACDGSLSRPGYGLLWAQKRSGHG
jgi:SAM-dependent methyltransferase